MVVVAFIQELVSASTWRGEDHGWGFPREGSEEGVVGVVIVED
jgi:hypothetical protein